MAANHGENPAFPIAAEEALIGGVLVGGKEAYDRIKDRLKSTQFSQPITKDFWRLFEEFDRAGELKAWDAIIAIQTATVQGEKIAGLDPARAYMQLGDAALEHSNYNPAIQDGYVKLIAEAHQYRVLHFLQNKLGDPTLSHAERVELMNRSGQWLGKVTYDEAGNVIPTDELGEAPAAGKPEIRLDGNIVAISNLLAEIFDQCEAPYYRLNNRIVTIDPETLEFEELKKEQFRTDMQDYARFFKAIDKMGRIKEITPAVDVANGVMHCKKFTERLRAIKRLNRVSLPVIRKSGELEFLPQGGWDDETQTVTLDRLDYRQDLTREESVEIIEDYIGQFDFRDERSKASQVASMLACYCFHVFPEGHKRMAFITMANQAGSGKSLLAAMRLIPVFNENPTNNLSRGDELEKLLYTKAQEGAPVVNFDDVKGKIADTRLNAFITSRWYSGRILGKSDSFKVENFWQVFFQGNHLELDTDMMRRSVIIDLRVDRELGDRVFKRTLSESVLEREEERERILAALCGLVKNWNRKDRIKGKTAVPTFEDWSSILGGIVEAAGYGDPFEQPDLGEMGDVDTAHYRLLLEHLAEKVLSDTEELSKGVTQLKIKFVELVVLVRKLQIFERYVSSAEDPDNVHAGTEPKERKNLGGLMTRYGGRLFRMRGTDGRKTDVEMKITPGRSADGAVYEFELLGL